MNSVILQINEPVAKRRFASGDIHYYCFGCKPKKESIMEISNYVITHKPFNPPQIATYKPLQVGNGPDLNWLRDNVGENIAAKNKNYCELTGVYWVWKNDRTSDVVGINHYRRFFYNSAFNLDQDRVLTEQQIQAYLADYDIILPKAIPLKESLREQYCHGSGYSWDLYELEKILRRDYPEYLATYEQVMEQNLIHPYNMLICSRELFDEYAVWLFDILGKLEEVTDLSTYANYQKRIYGFIGERLLNVWVAYRGLKVKELRTLQPEHVISQQIRQIVRAGQYRTMFALRCLLNRHFRAGQLQVMEKM